LKFIPAVVKLFTGQPVIQEHGMGKAMGVIYPLELIIL
jgi:hypothetical protein